MIDKAGGCLSASNYGYNLRSKSDCQIRNGIYWAELITTSGIDLLRRPASINHEL